VQLDFEVILVDYGGVIEPNLSVRESGDISIATDAIRIGYRIYPGE